jgi:HEPN domain-containing protein
MRDADRAAAIAREWIAKAENDLLNAAHTLGLGRRCPTDTVCFHAQQCAEKYLKALLSLRGVDFAKTHDLEALAARLRNGRTPAISQDDLAGLTRHATVTRYPGAEEIGVADARRAVAAARRVRRAVRAMLPKEVLRRKRRRGRPSGP